MRVRGSAAAQDRTGRRWKNTGSALSADFGSGKTFGWFGPLSTAGQPISSHQAASNCGPRRLSGSSEENICATAPFAHNSRRRAGLEARPLAARDRQDAGRPSIITSRTSASVSPTSAIRPYLPSARTAQARAPARSPIRRRAASCRRRARRSPARSCGRRAGADTGRRCLPARSIRRGCVYPRLPRSRSPTSHFACASASSTIRSSIR